MYTFTEWMVLKYGFVTKAVHDMKAIYKKKNMQSLWQFIETKTFKQHNHLAIT